MANDSAPSSYKLSNLDAELQYARRVIGLRQAGTRDPLQCSHLDKPSSPEPSKSDYKGLITACMQLGQVEQRDQKIQLPLQKVFRAKKQGPCVKPVHGACLKRQSRPPSSLLCPYLLTCPYCFYLSVQPCQLCALVGLSMNSSGSPLSPRGCTVRPLHQCCYLIISSSAACLLLLPLIFSRIRLFSNELDLPSSGFSFIISPANDTRVDFF